MPGPEGVRTK